MENRPDFAKVEGSTIARSVRIELDFIVPLSSVRGIGINVVEALKNPCEMTGF